MKCERSIPVEEYLRTTYDPDCDYVDGEVIERNLGELDHSDLQSELVYYFRIASARVENICVSSSSGSKFPSTRFRIPDVCVVRG